MTHQSTSFALPVMAILVSSGAAGWVNAQDDNNAAIDPQLLACNAIEDSSDRLACFDSVVESLKKDESATVATAATETPAAVRESAADTATPAAAAQDSAAAGSEVGVAVASGTAMSGPEPTPDAPAIATGTSQAQAPVEQEIGVAESLDNVDEVETDLSGSAAIVRVWRNLDGRFSVELDNGQVWRETEGSRVGMPKVGSAVEVVTGAFGSYRMKIDGIPREARVRRTNPAN